MCTLAGLLAGGGHGEIAETAVVNIAASASASEIRPFRISPLAV
jgi:hypothetical protein